MKICTSYFLFHKRNILFSSTFQIVNLTLSCLFTQPRWFLFLSVPTSILLSVLPPLFFLFYSLIFSHFSVVTQRAATLSFTFFAITFPSQSSFIVLAYSRWSKLLAEIKYICLFTLNNKSLKEVFPHNSKFPLLISTLIFQYWFNIWDNFFTDSSIVLYEWTNTFITMKSLFLFSYECVW